jgi:hypothetical protein
MFLGHFGVALAAKRLAPRASLALLILAAQLADVIWPVLVALGVEQVRIDPGNTAFTPLDFAAYPYSHSLLLLAVWGLALGLLARGHVGGRAALPLIAGLVVSHWVLDWITHRPDMPLFPRGPLLGLGLWNSVPWTLAVELVMFAGGSWLYLGHTRAKDAVGRWGFVALVAFLLVAYLANLGSVPPSVTALYATAMAGVLVIAAWAWWVDRHRAVAPDVA